MPEVAFADAALRYDRGLPRALDGVSLTLPPGGRVAVTGSSGAGKSSLVTALLRYWPLEGGTLSLGGTDVEQLRQADVRERLRAGRPTGPDVRRHGAVQPHPGPARRHRAGDRRRAARRPPRRPGWPHCPHGLDTPVGEDGVALSGGERRRLAVARALLAPGPVVVLDEPTSGLDPGLADELIDGVFAAAGERSVLVITHRAAEAARCDATVTLEAGRVVSSPTLSGHRPLRGGPASDPWRTGTKWQPGAAWPALDRCVLASMRKYQAPVGFSIRDRKVDSSDCRLLGGGRRSGKLRLAARPTR